MWGGRVYGNWGIKGKSVCSGEMWDLGGLENLGVFWFFMTGGLEIMPSGLERK